jgi:hypothetical protein
MGSSKSIVGVKQMQGGLRLGYSIRGILEEQPCQRMLKLLIFVCFLITLPSTGFAQFRDSVESADSAKKITDTTCACHPSIPLEIAASALTVGMIEYWTTRIIFDDTFEVMDVGGLLIGPALLLYMATLAPVANWTSGCEANAWNTVWIGFLSQAA